MDLKKLQIDRSESRRRRRRAPGLGCLIALALVAVAGWFFRAPLLALLDRWRLPQVEVATVVRSSPMAAAAASGAAANGYVVARRRAALSADTPGRIVEMNVEEGSVVRAGDVVARLYSDEDEAILRRAKADLLAGETAVAAGEARMRAAGRRLEEARANVASGQAVRAEAQAGVELARLDEQRSRGLLESGTDTQERLDRARTALVQAEARLASADAGIERDARAVESAAAEVDVAQAELAQAQAAQASLTAARDLAQATLDKTFVRAPFDGVIVLKDAEVGEVVSPNAQGAQSRGSVATMVDFASLEVQVELPETSLSSARVGERAEVFLDAFPEERFTGEVLRIWPTANRQKATVEVRVGLERVDERMRPEMGARVVFTAPGAAPAATQASGQAEPALLVPSAALVRVDGADGAFVVERDEVRFQALSLGPVSGTRTAVKSGLAEGERVVLNPPSRLSSGDRVRIAGQE
jgi:RND family efflux transporter MFP subunit